jgi:hypothetical protein
MLSRIHWMFGGSCGAGPAPPGVADGAGGPGHAEQVGPLVVIELQRLGDGPEDIGRIRPSAAPTCGRTPGSRPAAARSVC